jgi:hypothetical protein
MQVSEEADGKLVVRHDSTRWMRWTMGGAFVLLVVAAHDYWTNSGLTERAEACLGSAATLVVIGLATAESGRFAFDRRRRIVEWRRRWAWWRREGTIAFADISEVRVESPIGDEGEPSRRIVLKLADGRTLPLRASYTPDGDGALAGLAERLRALVGRPGQPPSPPSDAVAALVREGRMIEAIKELRRTRGLSLLEAKQAVDHLRGGTTAPASTTQR